MMKYDSVTELLQMMVQHDTVTTPVSGKAYAEANLGKALGICAQEMGLTVAYQPTVDGYADNVMVSYEVDASKPWLIFDSHMDTVGTIGMTIEPFSGTLKNGSVWGRGSSDTKGTGACALWALHKYMEEGKKPFNVAVLFTVNEEEGMVGAKTFATRDYSQIDGDVLGIVVCEPTDCTPIIAHNGTGRYKITTRGKSVHSSVPNRGKSAISAMVSVIDALEQNYIPTLDREDAVTGKAAMSINVIRGGDSVNIIPDQCEAWVDRRLVPGESADVELARLNDFLKELATKHAGLEVSIEMENATPPLPQSKNGRLLKLIEQVRSEMGLTEAPYGAPFATNGAHYAELDCDVVVIGPGDITQAHTKDEHITVSALEVGVKLYLGMMQGGENEAVIGI
ncbi:M20 family metallopeptidase [Poriferisphaera sp. WC338]|uniref:M20 family metallopeptidase n=1 Tax=Poriferisphaera sp. WC338 TaxID=3425129 RepID=UPI003D818F4F